MRWRGSGARELDADGLRSARARRAASGSHPLGVEGAACTARSWSARPRRRRAEQVEPRRRDRRAPIAIRFDHARLARESRRCARSVAEPRARTTTSQSDEVLKLSEALFAQDIELLRNNEKLGKIEKLKNDFIEKMSRELRTPLNSIIEAIISVLTGENDTLSETAQDRAAQRARRRHRVPAHAPEHPRPLAHQAGRAAGGDPGRQLPRARRRGDLQRPGLDRQQAAARSRRSFVEPLPQICAPTSPSSTRSCSCCSTTRRSSRREGRIEIRGRRRARGSSSCAIEDTGIGICPDDQQFIFDEFYQVDEPASQKYRGAGLGLTLVRDLITLLDGEISISERGRPRHDRRVPRSRSR